MISHVIMASPGALFPARSGQVISVCSLLSLSLLLLAGSGQAQDRPPYQDPAARNHWAYQPVKRPEAPGPGLPGHGVTAKYSPARMDLRTFPGTP